MDGKNFDVLVRSLGAGRSRRSVLKGLVAGGALVAAGRAGSTLAKKPDAYDLCHVDKKGRVSQISVKDKKVQEHLDEGDTFLGSDTDCSACGVACGPNETCIDFTCVGGPVSCDWGSAPDGNGVCALCAPGSASSDGQSCELCAVGMYAANPGQYFCDSCPFGQGTDGNTGATSCSYPNGGFICESTDQCQQACPGSAFEDFCYCSTIWGSGEPVCYRSGNGCADADAYCDSSADCPGDQVCLDMTGGCGGCNTGGRGICNSIC